MLSTIHYELFRYKILVFWVTKRLTSIRIYRNEPVIPYANRVEEMYHKLKNFALEKNIRFETKNVTQIMIKIL